MTCKLSKTIELNWYILYFMVCFLLKSYHLVVPSLMDNILMRSKNEGIGTDIHMYRLDWLNEKFSLF